MNEKKPAQQVRDAAILVIGDEVLSGKILDRNSHWLAGQLYAMGIPLRRILVVPDDVDVIAEHLRQLSKDFDLVLTSGGIGPTHDDKTYLGVSQAFDLPIVREQAIVDRMREHYSSGQVNEARLKMADIPQPDELCFNAGMVTGVVRVANVYILPGIPSLLQNLFSSLKPRFLGQKRFLGIIRTQQREGEIAALLSRVDAEHPDVQIGSYPRLNEAKFRVQLVVEGHEQSEVEQAYAKIYAGLDAAELSHCDEVHLVESAASLHQDKDGE